ncbi:beta-galactosidase-1-like protein 3 [Anthonomus grandis grandis]|uniref:beta-galactosidase-1-like protein 3 n=1 Tax=Anthonomus grandis grandis TaxID=2921223 RepID=UPI0021656CC8|nr:beta-galactosidase-1-like protein 3 [Anthonomus grandis grandis]
MTGITAPGNTTLPTLYEYYTSGGIQSGLNADQSCFTLNGKNITLYSGAMHYFRTPKQLWRDRLRKMRAAGLNAVETYVPWNLHEPTPGTFDFGHGGTDMEDFLDIETFLKTAQEEDLLAILRPGPYICAEWEFGGFPSWLLRENNIKFRTNDEKYMGPVKRFFNALLPILAALQFINGGPIISFQIENEYASTQTDTFVTDKDYLRNLRQVYLDNNITSLLTTADGVYKFGDIGTIPELFLVTANFGGDPITSFNALESIQPGRPKMAMEYYPGWFDHWSEEHHTRSTTDLSNSLIQILSYPGSFNIYMFHGGTNFGFLNGANVDNDLTDNSGFQPVTTSYDYDGPLTEAGDYSDKYAVVKAVLDISAQPKTKLPEMPELTSRVAFGNISLIGYISLKDLIDTQDTKLVYQTPTAMELININNNSGQSYGYITYRKENLSLKANATLLIEGHVCDSVLVLVNGKQISPSLKTIEDLNNFGFYRMNNSQIVLTDVNLKNVTIDLIVENWSRLNYGQLTQYYQFKGIWQGNILIDDEVVESWQHIPLEFKKSWTTRLEGWKDVSSSSNEPGLYKAQINITTPTDTYIDMRQWTKGIVIVNGFVLGRFARIGPQQCLYWPAPLMKQGFNEIIIFEHFEASNEISFSKDQIFKTVYRKKN